jgi:hypothetical protein
VAISGIVLKCRGIATIQPITLVVAKKSNEILMFSRWRQYSNLIEIIDMSIISGHFYEQSSAMEAI